MRTSPTNLGLQLLAVASARDLGFITTGEMARRLEATLRLFEQEIDRNPRVLAIGLHPHLIGVPHRFHELTAMLDLLQRSPHVVFTTGPAIRDWYAAAEPHG
jgi:hypothetical protein